jgi:N-acetylmuramoyl-L-alanine amidase
VLEAALTRARALLVVGLVVVGMSTGCKQRAERAAGRSQTLGEPLMPRQEVVALADRLAAAAARETGADAVHSLSQAANLRERVWRLEGRAADGLEAVELLWEAGKSGSCFARVSSHALRAEVQNSPADAVQALSRLLSDERDPECQQWARKLLGILAGSGSETPHQESTSDPKRLARRDDTALPDVVVPSMSQSLEKHPPRVTSVQRYGSKDSARIVVALSHPTTFRAGLLRSDDGGVAARLYVDIDHAVVDKAESYEVGGLVHRVRLGQRSEGTRVVLDLEEPAERRVFYMPEPFRLIVDVARGSTAPGPSTRGPRVIERIVIDPGHGGHDPGAIGPRGLREKDVTLDIAHRAGPLIARELALSTLLTRDTDAYVALDERTARANAFRADLFVSIHCNAAERTGSDGVMTFVLDASSDAAASRMAALENAASDAAAKELATTFGRSQDEGLLTRSLHFAELLQRSTISSLSPLYGPIQNQGVRRAGFYVLAGAHMPAVLFEVAFISNPDGEVRLNTADYRQKLADSLVNAVRAYRDGL